MILKCCWNEIKARVDCCMEQYHGLFTTMYASYQRKYNSTSDIQFSKNIETSHFVASKINHVNNLTNDERCFSLRQKSM